MYVILVYHKISQIKQDGQLFTSFKFAPFSSRIRREGGKDAEEKRLGQLLLTAIEPSIVLVSNCIFIYLKPYLQNSFPRGKYAIAVTILDDGSEPGEMKTNISSCLSAGVTCATLALVNSGVQMYDMALGLDIETEFNKQNKSSVVLLPQLRQVSMFNAEGLDLKDPEALQKVLDEAFQRADKLYATIRSVLMGFYKKADSS